MFYSVELLENGKIFIQPNQSMQRHGCKGKVLIVCLKEVAIRIKQENNLIQ